MPAPKARLDALRQQLAANNVAAYVIPTQDAHNSEYICAYDERRAWISGFDGSAGTAVVTATEALLWTDGRYFAQAAQQLGPEWTLMKGGLPETPTISGWLSKNVTSGKIGMDPYRTSYSFYRDLKEKVGGEERIALTEENLLDKAWGAEHPPMPKNPLIVHPIEYSGRSTGDKLVEIRKKMLEEGCGLLPVCALDEICWLLNCRGSDIPYNPVFFAYALVPLEGDVVVYIDESKLDAKVRTHLQVNGITKFRPYNAIVSDLSSFASCVNASANKKVWLDPNNTNMALYKAVPEAQQSAKESPIQLMKAIKNEKEIKGLRDAHIRDGAAKCKYLCWLENAMLQGAKLNECTAADKLEAFRREQPGFMDLSFPSISGMGPNGAIIHYHAHPATCRDLSNGMYLIDSGAQFCDGTTDVTRTVYLGHAEPSQQEKECFTRVLKGHINLARAVFPQGVSGPQLDALARLPLWEVGLDYRHGTGHGVGAFLNVHEGPCGISSVCTGVAGRTPLKEGMCLSNEPGYYQDGDFGIRIESLVIVVQAETRHKFGGKPYLCFDTITMVPMQKKLVDWELMSKEDVEWLNEYHQMVLENVEPLLADEEPYVSWLRKACAPVVKPANGGFNAPPPTSMYQ